MSTLARERGTRARVEVLAHWLAVAACVFFLAVACWGAFGPSPSGHLSTSAAYAMAGENIVNYRMFAVVQRYLPQLPPPSQYYCHHPYGIMLLEAVAYLLFGHHWFTVRAGAIFCSAISAPLIYAFGRRAWGILPAAVATLFFVLLPIDLSFSNFSNLEEPTIAFGLLFAWATARLWDTWKTRDLVLSAVGALGCCNGDWAGILFIGTVGIFAFFRAYVLPRGWYGRIVDRSHAAWFAYATAAAVFTLVLYLVLFVKADKLDDFIGSYHQRASGGEVPLAEHLSQKRKLWLGVMLTPVAYWVTGLGMPVVLARLVKKPLEIFAVAWLFAASFQYFGFRQGADHHIFWPHYYAPTAAFAAGSLTCALVEGRVALSGYLGQWNRPRTLRVLRVATACAVGAALVVPLALLARMGLPALVLSRKTAGRFDQDGSYIGTDADMAQFAEWAFSNVGTAGSTAQILERFDFHYGAEYALARPAVRVQSLTHAGPEDPQRIALLDARVQPAKTLATVSSDFEVKAVGPYWRVDRAQKGPSFAALRYEERQPTVGEWLLDTGPDLARTIRREADPWATWEWRDALDLPASSPTETPVSVDELRVAHNVAVHDHNAARAGELREQLAALVGKPLGFEYTDGLRLLGVDIQKGPATVVTLFWEADEHFKRTEADYQVKCKIVAPPRLWPTLLDYNEKNMAPPQALRPAFWRPGYLYAQRFIALDRVGRDECRGGFSADLHVTRGEPNPVIFTLN